MPSILHHKREDVKVRRKGPAAHIWPPRRVYGVTASGQPRTMCKRRRKDCCAPSNRKTGKCTHRGCARECMMEGTKWGPWRLMDVARAVSSRSRSRPKCFRHDPGSGPYNRADSPSDDAMVARRAASNDVAATRWHAAGLMAQEVAASLHCRYRPHLPITQALYRRVTRLTRDMEGQLCRTSVQVF